MNKKIIAYLIAAAIIIVGGYGLYQTQNGSPNSNNSPETQNSTSVKIQDFSFNPATLTIKKGETVTWTNEDSIQHTATSAGNFDSGMLSKGKTFSHTFDETGTFDYTCTPHPAMKGKIIVE